MQRPFLGALPFRADSPNFYFEGSAYVEFTVEEVRVYDTLKSGPAINHTPLSS